ncbi:hypothetical protein NIES2100_59740 [Calothrix sp. NIES-2100]|uniref:hypothetical protein n=1 Tax=Calothrix sp. NIES-2100 TaxID=1954172 RepID=UPI000B5EF856|nr:hypothetical protein NIES2100_59740 [Calothrix sp. NIES-2100]
MIKLLSTLTVASTLFSLCLPMTALAQVGDSLCSMTTSSGTTINLSSLCSGSSQASELQSGLYLQGVTAKRIKEVNSYKRFISGVVANKSNELHFGSELVYQIYNLKSGQLVVTDSNSKPIHSINPGELVSFNFEVPLRFDVIVIQVKSDKFSGSPICFANTQEKENYCRQLTREVRRL